MSKMKPDNIELNEDAVDLITLLVDQGWDHQKIVRACGGVVTMELSLDRILGKEVPTRTDSN